MSKDCQHSYHLDGTDPAVFLIIFFIYNGLGFKEFQ